MKLPGSYGVNRPTVPVIANVCKGCGFVALFEV